MVSNASDDFPEPLGPVTTMSRLRGSSQLTLRRLCCLAPRTMSRSIRAPIPLWDWLRIAQHAPPVRRIIGAGSVLASLAPFVPIALALLPLSAPLPPWLGVDLAPLVALELALRLPEP